VRLRLLLAALPAGLAAGPHALFAQTNGRPDALIPVSAIDSTLIRVREAIARLGARRTRTFRSEADSLDWDRVRMLAAGTREFRVVVSLFDRMLWVLIGHDTLLAAPAAVASGLSLDYAGRSWTFRTPRGRHRVLSKTADPVWTPPDWAYAEVALEHELDLGRLSATEPVRLRDGSVLAIRDSLVGVIRPPGRAFVPLPTDEHIVFDGTLFIPPIGTRNRRITGELGRFALDLGDGYLIHGTPDATSIGRAITHGCIRLRDEDIAWLYKFARQGTPVFIY
jgi:hypothetical protein